MKDFGNNPNPLKSIGLLPEASAELGNATTCRMRASAREKSTGNGKEISNRESGKGHYIEPESRS